MKTRPTSVTVISWFLIITGLISGIMSFVMRDTPEVQAAMAQHPLPVHYQYVLLYVGLAISIISALLMLQGINAGRLLYTGWGTIGLIIGFATSPTPMILIPGTVIFGLFVALLFSKKASAFFQPSSGIASGPPASEG